MFYNDELIIMVCNDPIDGVNLKFYIFAMLIIHDLSRLNIKKGVNHNVYNQNILWNSLFHRSYL